MSAPETVPPPLGQEFLGARYAPLQALAESGARYAVLGVPQGIPYAMPPPAGGPLDSPRAIRERARRFGRMIGHHDFDLGAALDSRGPLRLVDCGDVAPDAQQIGACAARATDAVAAIVRAGAVPIVLGGDDSVTALAIRGFRGEPPMSVLQIDAHIDYRDEVGGVRDGYSSPMRRAAEMPWVRRIVHCGIRGVGSARSADVRDTLERGNAIVTAREIRRSGVQRVLDEFEPAERCYVAFDCDGVDPSVMPGTSAPLPGGLAFDEAADLLVGLARRGRLVGISFAEHYPSLDVNGITALAIVRLIVNVLGALALRDDG
ncbi:MAG TPA: arginase family protein [Burkholderiaceae bacterium]|nr:arginase family protein [Burkholderiaceae bacterium]